MTIGSIFLALALLILVGLFVARPLVRTGNRAESRTTPYQALVAQKEALLVQIRNLDFDYETGKLREANYQLAREEYMVEAEDIFRKIDEFEKAGPVSLTPATSRARRSLSYEDDIEMAIALRRAQSSTAALAADEVTMTTENGEAIFCPKCGKPTDPDDKFCASCGHKLLNPQHV